MAKLKPQAGHKAKYSRYQQKGSLTKNARMKLERHLKKHPQDEQAQEALKHVAGKAVRKKPQSKLGWVKEGLRNNMVYLPYLTAKGTPIAAQHPDQFERLIKTHCQNVALTRSNVTGYAQLFRFVNRVPFQKTAEFETIKVNGESVVVVKMKHTSKLSNFKGKITKKTAELKAATSEASV